jgi:hypothetical protein
MYEGSVVGSSVVAALLLKLIWDTFGFDRLGTIFCLTEYSDDLIYCIGAFH